MSLLIYRASKGHQSQWFVYLVCKYWIAMRCSVQSLYNVTVRKKVETLSDPYLCVFIVTCKFLADDY